MDKWQQKPTNLKGMQGHLREQGISLSKTPYGEFRVNHKNGKEETAYYTDDLGDAGLTGQKMAGYKNLRDKQAKKS